MGTSMEPTPKSCKECMYASMCCSWYGGTQCKYRGDV